MKDTLTVNPSLFQAFAIIFVEAKTGKVSHAGIFSEPHPTCDLKYVTFQIKKSACFYSYQEARDSLLTDLMYWFTSNEPVKEIENQITVQQLMHKWEGK